MIVKLAFVLDDRYLSDKDTAFVSTVSEDLRDFILKNSTALDVVLLFPPVNNYLRLLIHKTVESEFDKLHSFSIGQGDDRRTVVCWKDSLLLNRRDTDLPVSTWNDCSDMRGRGRTRGYRNTHNPGLQAAGDSSDRWGHDRYMDDQSAGVEHVEGSETKPELDQQPTHLGRGHSSQATTEVHRSRQCAADNTVTSSPASQDGSRDKKERHKNRRPDVQVYMPRGRRQQQQGSHQARQSADRPAGNTAHSPSHLPASPARVPATASGSTYTRPATRGRGMTYGRNIENMADNSSLGPTCHDADRYTSTPDSISTDQCSSIAQSSQVKRFKSEEVEESKLYSEEEVLPNVEKTKMYNEELLTKVSVEIEERRDVQYDDMRHCVISAGHTTIRKDVHQSEYVGTEQHDDIGRVVDDTERDVESTSQYFPGKHKTCDSSKGEENNTPTSDLHYEDIGNPTNDRADFVMKHQVANEQIPTYKGAKHDQVKESAASGRLANTDQLVSDINTRLQSDMEVHSSQEGHDAMKDQVTAGAGYGKSKLHQREKQADIFDSGSTICTSDNMLSQSINTIKHEDENLKTVGNDFTTNHMPTDHRTTDEDVNTTSVGSEASFIAQVGEESSKLTGNTGVETPSTGLVVNTETVEDVGEIIPTTANGNSDTQPHEVNIELLSDAGEVNSTVSESKCPTDEVNLEIKSTTKDAKITAPELSLNIDVKTMVNELSTNAENIDIELNTNIENTDSELNTNIENTDSELNTNKENTASELNTNKENTASELNTNIENSDSELNTNIDNTDSELNTNIENSDSELNTNIDNTDSELNTNIENTDSELNTNIENSDSELNTNIDNTDSELNTNIENSDSDLNTNIENTDSELNTNIENTDSELNTNIDNTDSELNTNIENTDSDLNTNIENTDSELKQGHETTVSDINAATSHVSMEEEEEDSWDAMFNDDGECLDPSAMEELEKTVGKVKISNAKKINYVDYQPKDKAEYDMSQYGHIIEIYNFPAEFATRDLIMAFQSFMSRGFDLKWVDDTHALGIFSSVIAARDALDTVHPLLKVCPLSQASKQSQMKARKCAEFLQPYKPRPETTATAARRLVAGALGLATNVPKEKRDLERQQLKEAKAKRRQDRQNRDHIWEYGKCAMDEES